MLDRQVLFWQLTQAILNFSGQLQTSVCGKNDTAATYIVHSLTNRYQIITLQSNIQSLQQNRMILEIQGNQTLGSGQIPPQIIQQVVQVAGFTAGPIRKMRHSRISPKFDHCI